MAYTFKYGDRPLDGLTIQRAVGRGGFGEVYYALTDSGKQVALKYLRENPEIELRGIAHVINLKSPHLITVYDVRRDAADEAFVIMEYVSGPSLRELLDAEPQGMGVQKAGYFLSGIAKGLAYLHDRGIVHRDLKPGNIFYDDGYVKIGDYGLSKHMSVSRHSGQTVSVGTVHYMAPEIGSGSYSKAIDVYALGVILYEMITGRLPFTGSSMAEILMRHLNDRPDTTGIPEPFAGVIARSLSKNPQDRFPDVNAMVDAVVSVSEWGEQISRFDPSMLTRTERRPNASDDERTRTVRAAPRPTPPNLDAREFQRVHLSALDLPPIPPIPPLPGSTDRAAPPQTNPRPATPSPVFHAPAHNQPTPVARTASSETPFDLPEAGFRERLRTHWRLVVTAGMIVVAAAAGITAINRGASPEFGAALALLISGAAAGVILSHAWFNRWLPEHTEFIDRMMTVACGFACMVPGFAAAADLGSELPRVGVALAAVLFLFDWRHRIERGRRLDVKGHHAIGPAIAALIVTTVLGAKHLMWVSAGAAAALAYVVPLLAPLLSSRRRASDPLPVAPGLIGSVQTLARDAVNVADREVRRAAENLHVVARFENAVREKVAPPASPPSPPAQTEAIGAAQPSFVGRAANAGLGLIAKVLLLAGLALAVAQSGPGVLRFGDSAHAIAIDRGTISITDAGEIRSFALPRIVAVGPVMLGAMLLLVSRRGSGPAHFTRGIVAAGFSIAAVFMAMGPLSSHIAQLFAGDLSRLDNPGMVVLLSFVGIIILMLLWPSRSRRTIYV